MVKEKQQDPLDEVFTTQITIKELKEKDELIETLKHGINQEISNINIELKESKIKTKELSDLNKEYQEVFEGDKRLFKEQGKKIKRIKSMVRICCDWNKKKIDSEKAMLNIWNLFKTENLEYWNNKEESA